MIPLINKAKAEAEAEAQSGSAEEALIKGDQIYNMNITPSPSQVTSSQLTRRAMHVVNI